MSKVKRIIAACLLLATVLSLAVACGNSKNPTDTTVPTDTGDGLHRADYLPEIDYGGATFSVLQGGLTVDIHLGDDEPISKVDNATVKVNALVENRFGIKIDSNTETNWWDTTHTYQRLAESESVDYDLISLVCSEAYNQIIAGNAPIVSDLPIREESKGKPWHNQSMNESVTFGDVQLFDWTSIDVVPGGSAVVYNKEIANSLNLEDLYQLVDDGKWTLDTMYTMAAKAAEDQDGSPLWTEDDRYGVIGNMDQISLLAYFGTGMTLINVENGNPIFNKSEALYNVFLMASEKLGADGMNLNPYKTWVKDSEESNIKGIQKFAANKSLFLFAATTKLVYLLDMEADYGVLPLPKADEQQDRYYSSGNTSIWLPLMCHSNLQYVMDVKEALAVECLNYYYPAYYEQTLLDRYVRGPEDVEMVKLITETVSFDMGGTLWWTKVRKPWRDTLDNDFSTNFTSTIQEQEGSINQLLADFNTFLAEKKAS